MKKTLFLKYIPILAIIIIASVILLTESNEEGPSIFNGPERVDPLLDAKPQAQEIKTKTNRTPIIQPEAKPPSKPFKSTGILAGRVVNGQELALAKIEVAIIKGKLPDKSITLVDVLGVERRKNAVFDKLDRNLSYSPAEIGELKKRFQERNNLTLISLCKTDSSGIYHFPGITPRKIQADQLAIICTPPKGLLPPQPIIIKDHHLGKMTGPTLYLYQPGVISGLVSSLSGKYGSASVLACRLGEERSIENKKAWCVKGSPFNLNRLTPGKWRLGAKPLGSFKGFGWGPIVSLREGEQLKVETFPATGPGEIVVHLLGPGKTPLECSAHVNLELIRLGPPGKDGDQVSCNLRLGSVRPKIGSPARFIALALGTYQISAQIEDLPPSSTNPTTDKNPYQAIKAVTLEQPLTETTLIFSTLPPLGMITVEVQDSEGLPIRNAKVTVESKDQRRIYGLPRQTMASAGGMALFRGLTALHYWVRAESPEFLTKTEIVDLTTDPGGSKRCRITLTRQPPK